MDFGAALQVAVAVDVLEVLYCVLLGASIILLADVRLVAVRVEPDELALFHIFELHNVFLVAVQGPPQTVKLLDHKVPKKSSVLFSFVKYC